MQGGLQAVNTYAFKLTENIFTRGSLGFKSILPFFDLDWVVDVTNEHLL